MTIGRRRVERRVEEPRSDERALPSDAIGEPSARHVRRGLRPREREPQERSPRRRHAELHRAEDEERIGGRAEREEREDEQIPTHRAAAEPRAWQARARRARRRAARSSASRSASRLAAASFTPKSSTAHETSPGTTASAITTRIGSSSARSSVNATIGPTTEPALSIMRWNAKAVASDSFSTDSATSASRGTPRTPLPMRSSERRTHDVPSRGGDRDERPRQRREHVPAEDERLLARRAIDDGADAPLHERAQALGDPFHRAEPHRGTAEREEQRRKQRIDHLAADVGEERDPAEASDDRRDAGRLDHVRRAEPGRHPRARGRTPRPAREATFTVARARPDEVARFWRSRGRPARHRRCIPRGRCLASAPC